jgi:hypothetical protein
VTVADHIHDNVIPNVNTPPPHPDTGAAEDKPRPIGLAIAENFEVIALLIGLVFGGFMYLIVTVLQQVFG